MKKILTLVILLLSILTITSCSKEKEELKNTYLEVTPNKDNKIIITKEKITSTATFINYKVDDVIIQFIVVKGTDGIVRIAFNTCQSCNPSENAYFKQVGEYLQCQNCRSKFHINKIGEEQGGCNPTPVSEKEETDKEFILDKTYVDTMKEKFTNLKLPTE